MQEVRYEKKFLIRDMNLAEVLQLIRFNPGCFTQIYTPRQIHSLYLDTPGFDSYNDTVDGNPVRSKVRIRWYGQRSGLITGAALEIKSRNGGVVSKDTYELPAFNLDSSFTRAAFQSLIPDAVPVSQKLSVMHLLPVLINSYERSYFISADRNIRLTVDDKLANEKYFFGKHVIAQPPFADHSNIILELKYLPEHEPSAVEIGNALGVRLARSSKYMQGMLILHP